VQGNINFRQQHVNAKLGSGGPTVHATTINGPAVVYYIGEKAGTD